MPGGNIGPGIILSLVEGFSEIGSVLGDGIRVGAGAVAAHVEAEAQSAGLTFPPLPSSAPWATLGGMIANNAAGARSFGYGATDAWVTEVEGFTLDGTPFSIRADGSGEGVAGFGPLLGGEAGSLDLTPSSPLLEGWPQLRKNSSGYALDRLARAPALTPLPLLIGSEGTLVIITGAELRLTPAPQARGVHLLPVRTPDALSALSLGAPATGAVSCEFLGRRLLEVLAAVGDPVFMSGLLPADGFALLLLEFEGSGLPEVEAGLERARALGRHVDGEGFGTGDPALVQRLWGLRHRASPLIAEAAGAHLISTQFIEDSVVPPAALGAYIVGVEQILQAEATDAVIFGHAGDGNVHVNPLLDFGRPDERERVRRILDATVELVASLGGTLAGEHGDGRIRTPYGERIWGPARMAAFGRIKAQLDPMGLLNPGVKVPLPGQDPLTGFRPQPRRWPHA
jgi:FAD/FMN-containing dehydrogenase